MRAIEITNFPPADYEPLVDFDSWRVAVLAYCENTTPEKILTMQKHDETDEVFVLIVENRNTCDENSPIKPLTEAQQAELRRMLLQ